MFNHEPEGYPCPFCRILNSETEKKAEVLFETNSVFVCMPIHHKPASGPSLLIIPKQHVENIYDMDDSLLAELISLGKKMALAVKAAWKADGITLIQNNEPAGSQDVWHFHLHIKCRREGDNFWKAPMQRTAQALRKEWIDSFRRFMTGQSTPPVEDEA
ncbi:HIT family protein [Endozoicomonas numazuensis]|uniref:HIT family protein n=1 Tax=Endozoicomonas numazuensis TaxID=1137799 RepID=UPI000691E16A|nr:HIT domain-containing protein [Endozoicomonas numazuensis]